jgi:hypothetical protein
MSSTPTRGPAADAARLTVVSVLLGVMLAALVTALPPTPTAFVTHVFADTQLLLDLQVLALLGAMFNVWFQQNWATLLSYTISDLFTNVFLFLATVLVIAWALSVSDFRAWVAWGAAVIGLEFLGGCVTGFIYRRPVAWWRQAFQGAATVAAVYVACALNGALPDWATIAIPPLVYVGLLLAAIIVDVELFSLEIRLELRAARAQPAHPA